MNATTQSKIQLLPVGILKPHPQNSIIYGSEDESVKELAEKIQQSGWIQTLTATHNFTIISGHRRHAAAQLLGLDVVPVQIESFQHEWEALERLLLENEYRDKTRVQRLREFKVWKEVEAEKARLRQSELNGRTLLPDNCPEAQEKGEARDEAAKKAGLGSGRRAEDGVKALDKADELTENGEAEKAELLKQSIEQSQSGASEITKFIDELSSEDAAKYAKALREKEITVAQVRRKIEQQRREEAREQRRQENAQKAESVSDPLQAGAKFPTIVLDPPWDWGDEGDINQLGRAKPDYATMSFQDLLSLPIPELSDKDCHIYMWITNRSLPKGFQLLEQWGFRYIALLTWPKRSFGMGNYFRGQTEHVMFGVKGSQLLKRKDASTLLPDWKRGPNGHSSKPIEFYTFVESCSPGPFLELFSRVSREGWKNWGADV